MSGEFSFQQEVDAKGRPKSRVHGGIIKLTILLEDDDELLSWMFSEEALKDGKIVFMAGESKIQKTLDFQMAALISYVERFEDQAEVRVNISISTESLTIGGANFSNFWKG